MVLKDLTFSNQTRHMCLHQASATLFRCTTQLSRVGMTVSKASRYRRVSTASETLSPGDTAPYFASSPHFKHGSSGLNLSFYTLLFLTSALLTCDHVCVCVYNICLFTRLGMTMCALPPSQHSPQHLVWGMSINVFNGQSRVFIFSPCEPCTVFTSAPLLTAQVWVT